MTVFHLTIYNSCFSAVIVYAGASLYAPLYQCCGGDVCGVLGIYVDLCHVSYHGCEDKVPTLGGVLVDADLHALQALNLGGERCERYLKFQGKSLALIGGPCEFEFYYMFSH